jgi:hypothetical protein
MNQVPDYAGYFHYLLTFVASALGQVLPYAAGMTGFAIALRMVRRWLGYRSALSLGSSFDGGRDLGEARRNGEPGLRNRSYRKHMGGNDSDRDRYRVTDEDGDSYWVYE